MKLDMSNLDDAPADYFIICSGDSTTQVKAISGNVSRRVKEELNISPAHIEGTNDARWCLVCLLYTSPSPRDKRQSRMPSSA